MAVTSVIADTADNSDENARSEDKDDVEEKDDDDTIQSSFATLSTRRVQLVPSFRAPRAKPEVVISRPSAVRSKRQIVDGSVSNTAVLQTSTQLPALTAIAAEHRVVASKPALPKLMVENTPVFGAVPAFVEGSSNMSAEVIDPEDHAIMAHGSSVKGEFSSKMYFLS
jgi:hypothetical protein